MRRAARSRPHLVVKAEQDREALRARLRRVAGFRLLWGRTWPKERGRWQDDFVGFWARSDEAMSARIVRDQTTAGRTGLWRWNASHVRHLGSGWEDDAGAAARAAEAAFCRGHEAVLKAAIRARLGRGARLPLP